mgnify:CR=1 FL=1
MKRPHYFLIAAITATVFGAAGLIKVHGMASAVRISQDRLAVAVLHPTKGNAVRGTVYFADLGDRVRILIDLKGLEPNSTHGFHIHQYGDCTASDATSAGGHYAPQGHKHGGPGDPEHHAGDLGNIQADANGMVKHEMTVDFVTIAGEHNPVLGRAVIVHAKPDDLESQPTGAAGARMACGVIGIANPEYAPDSIDMRP